MARLDEIDLAILDLLQEDGRRSATDVGRRIKLSPAAAKMKEFLMGASRKLS